MPTGSLPIPMKLAESIVTSYHTNGKVVVSTVLIPATTMREAHWETMVFPGEHDDDGQIKITDWMEIDCQRSYDEEMAHRTHHKLTVKWSVRSVS